MFPVREGDIYPVGGPHASHDARIVAVDTHGTASWEDLTEAPTITVRCSCGDLWSDRLVEAVPA